MSPDQQRQLVALRLIALHMEDDARDLDGRPFIEATVGQILRHLMEAIQALAEISAQHIEESS